MLRMGVRSLTMLSTRIRPNFVRLIATRTPLFRSVGDGWPTRFDRSLRVNFPPELPCTTSKWYELVNANRNNGFVSAGDLQDAVHDFTLRFFLEGFGKDQAQRSFVEDQIEYFADIHFLLRKYRDEMSIEECLGFLKAYTKQGGKISDFSELMRQAEKWKSLIPAADLIAMGSIKDSARDLSAIMSVLNFASRFESRCSSSHNFTFLLNNKDKLKAVHFGLNVLCSQINFTAAEIADRFEWIKTHINLLQKIIDYQGLVEANPRNVYASYQLQNTFRMLANHATLSNFPDMTNVLLKLKNTEKERVTKLGGFYFTEALFGASLLASSLVGLAVVEPDKSHSKDRPPAAKR